MKKAPGLSKLRGLSFVHRPEGELGEGRCGGEGSPEAGFGHLHLAHDADQRAGIRRRSAAATAVERLRRPVPEDDAILSIADDDRVVRQLEQRRMTRRIANGLIRGRFGSV